MDDLTAIAFAREAFELAHPTETWPFEIWRYATSGGVVRTRDGIVVPFVWQLKMSMSGAQKFFEVLVNPCTAETTVLLDTPLDRYRYDELEEYL